MRAHCRAIISHVVVGAYMTTIEAILLHVIWFEGVVFARGFNCATSLLRSICCHGALHRLVTFSHLGLLAKDTEHLVTALAC